MNASAGAGPAAEAPLPVLASAAPGPDAGLTPNVKPTPSGPRSGMLRAGSGASASPAPSPVTVRELSALGFEDETSGRWVQSESAAEMSSKARSRDDSW